MNYFIRKLLYSLVTLWMVATLTFILMRLLPGDPFTYDQGVPEAIQISLREYHGLNESVLSQYGRYLTQFMSGDFGTSILSDRKVNDLIKEAFPISATLALEAFILSIPLAILLGSFAALNKNSWKDHSLLVLSILGLSIPSFIFATLLQYYLAFQWDLFPLARWGTFMHTILPALTLALSPTIFLARLVRTSVLDTIKQDYIKTAIAKGIPFHLVFRKHILRNALPPLLPYLGQLTANILVGSFVVEKIFSIPGLGQWFVMSIGDRDYGVIMGLTLFYSVILLSTLLIADLLYAFFDPRIRLRE
jgi:oligopeptide transport system permease protein